MSHTEAGWGELEEEFEEKDIRFKIDGRTIKQLEDKGGAGDNNGAEHRKH